MTRICSSAEADVCATTPAVLFGLPPPSTPSSASSSDGVWRPRAPAQRVPAPLDPGYYFTGDGCVQDKDGYYWITVRGVSTMHPPPAGERRDHLHKVKVMKRRQEDSLPTWSSNEKTRTPEASEVGEGTGYTQHASMSSLPLDLCAEDENAFEQHCPWLDKACKLCRGFTVTLRRLCVTCSTLCPTGQRY
ncbi:unnamed protein product [Vitrella brassicaformis CCMP3155]|uniref:Uncharacterized protein n=1 Tax=Vitrella brassicaformis (strain CCMP3155) TaxID=1169540 RepID=A0A0G4FI62_VITBC|nr:unnamed protein product [Vitrella brassicaformis CCMP3155]|eukprot:CEM13148.1 unnamed protein product [Vitrella brassicaformis CCMP3155]